jgi:site-specific recombinase XerD
MGQNLVKVEKHQEIAKFDYTEQAKPFVLKSLSEETRRTYETHIKEFFLFHNLKHPVKVTATDVIRWRDALLKKGSRPATVTTKLSIVRSFCKTSHRLLNFQGTLTYLVKILEPS